MCRANKRQWKGLRVGLWRGSDGSSSRTALCIAHSAEPARAQQLPAPGHAQVYAWRQTAVRQPWTLRKLLKVDRLQTDKKLYGTVEQSTQGEHSVVHDATQYLQLLHHCSMPDQDPMAKTCTLNTGPVKHNRWSCCFPLQCCWT